MQFSRALALVAVAIVANASPCPQAMTSKIAPKASASAGCKHNVPSTFGIAVVPLGTVMTKREVDKHHKSTIMIQHGKQIVSAISDGQLQARTTNSVDRFASQISDGQVQAPVQSLTTLTLVSTITVPIKPITELSDGQPEARTNTRMITSVVTITTAVPLKGPSNISSAAPTSTSLSSACNEKGSLKLMLQDGVLADSMNRTGYIASNYQFQFDDPPQSEAIHTAGWSACDDGTTLALGDSTLFWECLSGDFYNLYDRYWAYQCSPVSLEIVKLVDC